MKHLSLLISLFLLASCSTQNNITSNKSVTQSVVSTSNSDTFIAKVSEQKGASIPVSIVFNTKFNTKAVNTDGIVEKKPSDITKVDVYLLSLNSTFNGTDPLGLGTPNANVVKSFTIAKTGSSFNILLTNIPGLATPNQYWVGIVAKDTNGNVISKAPGTAWAGGTLSAAPALSLSTTGVGVDATTLAITPSTTTSLTVNLSLLDAVGASISSSVNVTGGANNLQNSTINAQ